MGSRQAKIRRFQSNAGEKITSSKLGLDLVRLLSSEGYRIFSTEEARALAPRVGLRDSYLVQALYHLHRGRWIVPLRRGLYALATSVPGIAATHEFEIAMALVDPAAISHWSALHHHGLTEQASRDVFVLTTTQASVPRMRGKNRELAKGGYQIHNVIYRFVQITPERFFGVDKVWVGEARVTVTDPERTLLDGLSMPQYCGDFAEVIHAFQARGADLDLDRIIGYALRMGAAVSKRLGWVLERQGVPPDRLQPLLARPIKGYRILDVTGPRKGPYDRRWMIQENLPGRVRS